MFFKEINLGLALAFLLMLKQLAVWRFRRGKGILFHILENLAVVQLVRPEALIRGGYVAEVALDVAGSATAARSLQAYSVVHLLLKSNELGREHSASGGRGDVRDHPL